MDMAAVLSQHSVPGMPEFEKLLPFTWSEPEDPVDVCLAILNNLQRAKVQQASRVTSKHVQTLTHTQTQTATHTQAQTYTQTITHA